MMCPLHRNVTLASVAVLLSCLVQSQVKSSPMDQKFEPVETEMRNVNYHFEGNIMVHIEQLRGKLVPAKKGIPPTFDDQNSFTLAIDSARISISSQNLANLLNNYVFAEPGSPLREIKVAFEGSQIKIKGTLRKAVDVAFETTGAIDATPEGLIRIHTKKIKAAHIPAKGLMDLFGLEVTDFMNTKHTRGVRIKDDDFLLYPDQILPPPRISGRLVNVVIRGKRLIQVFGNQAKPQPLNASATPGNYIAYRGAVLRFGKLTMNDADLVLIDQDPRDPFDFALNHYQEMLTAGYSKTLPSGGLRTYMPDFNKIRKIKTQSKPLAQQR